MKEILSIISVCIFMAIALALTRKIQLWQIKRAYKNIIGDLRRSKAFSEDTAISLPYGRWNLFGFGLRDFRPKALEYLIVYKVVGKTDDGRFYLIKRDVTFLE